MRRLLGLSVSLALATTPACSLVFAPGQYSSGGLDAAAHDAGRLDAHDTGELAVDASGDADLDATDDADLDAPVGRDAGPRPPCDPIFGGAFDALGGAITPGSEIGRYLIPTISSDIRLDVLPSTLDVTDGTASESSIHDVTVAVGSGGQLVVAYVRGTRAHVHQALLGDLGGPDPFTDVTPSDFASFVEIVGVDASTSPTGAARVAAIASVSAGGPVDALLDCEIGGTCATSTGILTSDGTTPFDATSVAYVTAPTTLGGSTSYLTTLAYGASSLRRPDAVVTGWPLGGDIAGSSSRFALAPGQYLDVNSPTDIGGGSLPVDEPAAIAGQGDPTQPAWLFGLAHDTTPSVVLVELTPGFMPQATFVTGATATAVGANLAQLDQTVYAAYAIPTPTGDELHVIAARTVDTFGWVDLTTAPGEALVAGAFGSASHVREIDVVALRGDGGATESFALWAAVVGVLDTTTSTRVDRVLVGGLHLCAPPP